MIYNNTEFYIQDNWKVTNRLTLDYGMRFTRQQPQHDTLLQMSNFFIDEWSAAQAPLLYVPGCASGATVCSGNDRNAMHPITGEILTAPGANNTAAAIGTIIPNSGNLTNGIRQAGDGISEYGYVWPTLVYGPRFGMAYDLTGTQTVVFRGGAGLFYDRPDGNTVFSIPGNPPIAESQTLRNGMLQNLGQGLSTTGTSSLITFVYDADIPSSVQWNAGVQMALPWSSSLDLSYVGNRGYNRMGQLQGGQRTNLNAVDLGAAYLPQNQDPTKGVSDTPGGSALTDSLLAPLRGFGSIGENRTDRTDLFHSIQASFNRRFSGGLSFGFNYTWSMFLEGNWGLVQRLEHGADGSIRERADQGAYEELNKNLAIQPHVWRGNFVWDMPDLVADSGAKRALGYLLNDWQLSGIVNLSSGTNYDIGYTYQRNGSAINLTGSPDYNIARVNFNGDPGSGCSSNQYAQFNTSVISGPTYGSVGMESGRNMMRGCMQREIDISLARNIRLGGSRALQLRVDTFNTFNIVNYTGRDSTVDYVDPVSQRIRNSQTLADGSNDPDRLRPRNAGFGAVTSAGGMRDVRLTVRFSF
jgi:hypothetical protein